MTATTEKDSTHVDAHDSSPPSRVGQALRARRALHAVRATSLGTRLLIVAAGLVVVSIVARIADAPDLTSSGTAAAALRLAVPIGLAGLGGIYAERCGIVNIGLEGMMILGTWFGAWGAWRFGAWEGVALGILGGAIGGLIHAVATVTFNVDHVISGVAINILGGGFARYLSVLAYDSASGGGPTQSPSVNSSVGTVTLPLLSGGSVAGRKSPDVLGWLERKDWFFVGDGAGVLKGLTAGVSWVAVIALLLIPLSTWVLWRTRFGLRLRAAGEAPAAADSLGVSVTRYRYYGVVISGAMAGLAGVFLSTVAASIYREGQTAGRGYIGLATMIFGNWRPSGLAAGAGLFGLADALQLRSDASVRALLLLVAIGVGLLALRQWRKGALVRAGLSAALAIAFAVAYVTVDKVPSQLTYCTPYVVTLLVLASASQRLRPPAKAGQPYRKGQPG